MGWYAGLSSEEMAEHFGTGPKKGLPKDDVSDKNDNDNDDKSSPAVDGDSDGDGKASVKAAAPTACPLPSANDKNNNIISPPPPPEEYESIYHLCRKQDWETCRRDDHNNHKPYFPRTFLQDGRFTRASLYLEDMVDVANEYYQDESVSPATEEWIVLEIDPQFLYYGLGIPILADVVAPESYKYQSNGGSNSKGGGAVIKCLQIFGGLSTHPLILTKLIKSVYPMKRRAVDGKFVGMFQSMLSERSDAVSGVVVPTTTSTSTTAASTSKEKQAAFSGVVVPTTTSTSTTTSTKEKEKKSADKEMEEKSKTTKLAAEQKLQQKEKMKKKKGGFFRKLFVNNITSKKTTTIAS